LGTLEKGQFRKEILYRKRLLSEQEYQLRNNLMQALTQDFILDCGLNFIHTFLPMVKNREPDTFPLVHWLREQGIRPVISRADFKNMKMYHYHFDNDVKLVNNRMGIPEPQAGNSCGLEHIQGVLVPLVAMDKQGNRIGYGKGFYDRLLAEMDPSVKKIGLILSEPFDNLPFSEPHDVRMDYAISPYQIYKVNF
jgi:5-formyltetrahydrofolate cyclo-ligase